MSSDLNERAIGGAHVLTGPRELRRRRDGVVNGEELPGLVDATQTMRPAIGELQARACDEIPHSSGGENFAPTCGCRDPCADVNARPPSLSPTRSHSPVCTPARISRPRSRIDRTIAHAHRTATPGPSKLAKNPSPAVSSSLRRTGRAARGRAHCARRPARASGGLRARLRAASSQRCP